MKLDLMKIPPYVHSAFNDTRLDHRRTGVSKPEEKSQRTLKTAAGSLPCLALILNLFLGSGVFAFAVDDSKVIAVAPPAGTKEDGSALNGQQQQSTKESTTEAVVIEAETTVDANNPAVTAPEGVITDKPKKKRKPKHAAHGPFGKEDVVRIGQPLVVKVGESVGNAVVILNSATIEGEVEGDLVVVGGQVDLHGKVKGNLVAPMGSVRMGTNAEIGGDAIVVGGTLEKGEGASIGGQTQVHAIPFGEWTANFGEAVTHSAHELLFLGRPLSLRVHWVWGVWGAFFLLHGLLVIVFPKAIDAGAAILDQRPVSSFLMGLGAFPLWFLAVVLTSFTVVIPLALFFAIPGAFAFGKTIVARHFGSRIAHACRLGWMAQILPAFLVGTLLVTLFYLIPFVGLFAWGTLTLWGLGAVLLAFFKSLQHEAPAAPVPSFSGGISGPPLDSGSPATAENPMTDRIASIERLHRDTLAGFGRRLGAGLIDLALLSAIGFPTLPFGILLWLAYFPGFWYWRGTTIGGIVFGLRVVRIDGRPLDGATAVVRGFAGVLSLGACFLGFFWAAWDSQRQSWHDKIAGTLVTQTRANQALI